MYKQLYMEEESYIDLEDIINKKNKKKIYQFQYKENKCKIVLICESDETPEIIIEENFGKDNKYSLYSLIYEEKEIIKNNNNFLPIIRLINKKECAVYSICIKYDLKKNSLEINNYDNYFLISNEKINNQKTMYKKIEKEINSENILETLLEMVIDLGIIIY